MKKNLTILSCLVLISSWSFSKQIEMNTAKQLALCFWKSTGDLPKSGEVAAELVYRSYRASHRSNEPTTNYFYVFNMGVKGFVILSAEDRVIPILGYSTTGVFDAQNIPSNTASFLKEYEAQIQISIEKNIPASKQINRQWAELSTGLHRKRSTADVVVAPLIKTTWNQSEYYNEQCPFDTTANKRTLTGCVATAMAQIMKYWNYPSIGVGSNSYKHSIYGVQSANFEKTTYHWDSIPSSGSITSSNQSLTTLLYHCGVSVNMHYGVNSSSATGVGSAVIAFKKYFGYNASAEIKYKNTYTDSSWVNLLVQELDFSRPLFYQAIGPQGGHAFVCDGYDSDNKFHFNWGWGGKGDGYYTITNLNPDSPGGIVQLNSNHAVIMGIKKPIRFTTADIRLYDSLHISDTIIDYNKPFSITTKIGNYDTLNFLGNLSAVIFNDSGFVDYLEVKKGVSLPSKSQGTYTFSTPGKAIMKQGVYHLGLFYWQPDGEWKLVREQEYVQKYYENHTQMTVRGQTTSNVENRNSYLMQLYPNPSSGKCTLKFIASQRGEYRIELSNVLGQVLYGETLTDYQGNYSKEIDAEPYGKGMYLMKVSSRDGSKVEKLVIE
jgi:hypothetical protein